MRSLAALLTALMPLTGLAVACAPRPRTQVTIIVEAESTVAQDAIRLRTRVEGGTTELLERNIEVLGTSEMPVRFPVRASLIPLGGDATRRFRFEATAYDALDQELGTVRALSSFSQGHTGTIRLVLEDCCRPVRCAVDETCRSCACVPAMTTPISEDAGTRVDAAVTRVDAAFTPLDAAISVDAGTDAYSVRRAGCGIGTSCFEVDDTFATGEVNTMTALFQCSRPTSGCPSASLSGPAGCDVFRVYNARSAEVPMLLSIDAAFPTYLALYREDAADLTTFPGPPAMPAACSYVGGISESIAFTMPPGSVYRVVVGAVNSVDVGNARLNVQTQ